MKKRLLMIVVALCMVLALCLTACVPTGHTLTLYDNDGTTVLYTIKVEEGKAPQKPADPTKEGFTFEGWFITPTNKTEYDFSKPLTEDVAAYAQWKTAGYQDDRDWVAVGDFNGWAAADGYHLSKKAGEGNVYTITMDVQKDQQFKFTVLLEDGTLDYNNVGTGADVSFVMVDNPGEYFEGKGGIGDTPKNISCLVAGNYTFTLTTDPVNSNNSVSFVRNGDVSAPVEEVVVSTYIIKGSKVTNWGDVKDDESLQMKKGADGKFSLTVQLYGNDEFMFVGYKLEGEELVGVTKYIKSDALTADSCSQIAAKGDNMTTSADGTYTFVYDPVAESLKVTYSEEFTLEQLERPTTWYILGNGTQAGSVLNAANWGLASEENQKLAPKAGEEGVYQITLDLFVDDQFKICSDASWANAHDFTDIVNPGENFAAAGNVKVLVAGNYTLTLTIAEKEADDKIEWVRNGDPSISASEAVIDYYIKGAKITNWKDFYSPVTKLAEKSEGVFTLSVYLAEGDEFMFTSTSTSEGVVSTGTTYLRSTNLDADSLALFDETAGKNIVVKTSGNYTFTYTEATEVLTATLDNQTAPVAADYYIDGTFAEGVADWSGYCFQAGYKLAQDATNPNLYSIVVTMLQDKEFIIQAFKAGSTERGTWGTDSYNGLGSYNYQYLFNGGEKFSAVGDGNNNIKILAGGTYKVTFDAYSKMLTVEDQNVLDDAYVKGSMTDGWKLLDAWKMSYDEATKTYSITKQLAVGDEFGMVITIGASTEQRAWVGKANVSGQPAGFDLTGGNIKCTVAGTYTIKIDVSGANPVVTIVAAQ